MAEPPTEPPTSGTSDPDVPAAPVHAAPAFPAQPAFPDPAQPPFADPPQPPAQPAFPYAAPPAYPGAAPYAPFYPAGPYAALPPPVAPIAPPPPKPFKRRWLRWPRSPIHEAGPASLRSWIVASAIVFGPAALVDVYTGIANPHPLTLVWTFGLALFMAVVNGFLWSTAFGAVRRFPRFVPWVLWPALAIGAGALLANELGAYTKLGGKDHKLAVTALIACGGGSLFLGLLVALLQPRRKAPRGLLVRKRLWLRGLFVLGLLGAGGAAGYVDRKYFPGTYPAAHTALRIISLWFGMWAIMSTGARIGSPPLRRRRTIALVLFAVVALFPFFSLTERNTASIHDLLEEPLSSMLFKYAREVTDVDRDGYSSLLGGGDCSPFNSKIAPGAPEIPGNGIDDNCRLGDAKYVDRVADQAKVPVPAEPSPLSVLLITIDTLRADRLSVYGAARDTTPNLTRIAKTAVRFDCALTSGGWTSIAISSLMRGLYPRRLLWSRLVETTKYRLLRFPLEDGDLADGEKLRLGFALPLDDPLMPLARFLQRRGMHTMAVVDDGYSGFMDAEYSSLGFDHYIEVNPAGTVTYKNDEDTADLAIETLNGAPKDKPFFMWVHFFGPHEPNRTHPGLPSFGRTEADGYDHEIRFADMQVDRVVEALEKLSRPTAAIITSDHGEIIRNAKDRDHGSDLKPEILWVPLILRAPGLAPAKVPTAVSLVDIVPTILGLTNTPAPAGLDGIDLRKSMTLDATAPRRLLHHDTWRINMRGTFDVDMSAVSDGKYTLVRNRKENDLVLRVVCDKAMKQTNLFGKVPSKVLEDQLFRYEEETGGALRFSPRPERN